MTDPAAFPILGIDHLGVAVRDADAALPYYRDTLGLRLVGDEIAEDPGVRLVYLAAGRDLIQLVQPVRDCAVSAWLDQHPEGLHHVCFRVDDIAASLPVLGSAQPTDTIFRGGRQRRACFLQGAPVLVELTETQPTTLTQGRLRATSILTTGIDHEG